MTTSRVYSWDCCGCRIPRYHTRTHTHAHEPARRNTVRGCHKGQKLEARLLYLGCLLVAFDSCCGTSNQGYDKCSCAHHGLEAVVCRRRKFWTYVRKFTRNVRLLRSSYPIAGVSQTGLECHANNQETSTDRCCCTKLHCPVNT